MKKVSMMYLEGCPHCKKAEAMVEELKRLHPEYRNIEIEAIEETQEKELADSLDYYYVPTFYVDGVKLHEGVPSMEKIEAVLKRAL